MKVLSISLVICLLFVVLPLRDAGKILIFTPMGSRSHKIFFMGIAEALARKGHEVTMVSAFEPPKKIQNIREVVIQNFSLDSFLEDVFEDKDSIMGMFSQTANLCLEGLAQEHVQDLKKEEFDLLIMSAFFSQCYLSFVHHFKVPYIYAFSGGLFATLHDLAGNIDFPSISGNALSDGRFPFTFTERLSITAMNFFWKYMTEYILEPRMYSECLKSGFCPPEMPTFSEIHKNSSLIIINSVRTMDWPPKPAMPSVIYAGGAHIKPPKKLPKDLEKWVEGSGEEGFIFFSLGSALNPDFLPEKYRKILVKVFGSLKQRVLWKWNEETMPDLPKNVKLQKWLPQRDLLGHPKIKLFITHGGALSTLEAKYHGIPVIGMPVFADQHSNMRIIQSEGWGRVMEWEKLEEEVLRNIIDELLNNRKASEVAKHLSSLMKDRLVPPDEEAAYWVEYVMRHRGAPHLQSPIKVMSWYEVYNIDVWAFILLAIAAVLNILFSVTRFIVRKCCGAAKSDETDKEKRE